MDITTPLEPYLATIIKGMTAKQREAVLLTAAAKDGRVPYAVHDRTVDALYRKRLIREVKNRKGGFNWCVLTYNGKRIAKALSEQAAVKASTDAVAASKYAPTLDRQAAAKAAATGVRIPTFAEARALATGTEPGQTAAAQDAPKAREYQKTSNGFIRRIPWSEGQWIIKHYSGPTGRTYVKSMTQPAPGAWDIVLNYGERIRLLEVDAQTA